MSVDRQEELALLREKLIQRRNVLEASTARNAKEAGSLNVGVIGNHEAESASDITLQNTLVALKGCLTEQLNAVYYSLERYETGQYGICECCGCEIPIERLQVIPEATMCVNCQSSHSQRRPNRR